MKPRARRGPEEPAAEAAAWRDSRHPGAHPRPGSDHGLGKPAPAAAAVIMTTPASSRPCSMEKIRENASNCPNNEHNFFKKHSCDDDKEAMFLKTAARKLKLFFDMNIHDESKLPLKVISYGTLQLLTCTRKDKEKKQPPPSEAQPTKNLGEKKSLKEQKKLDDICFLVTLLDKIQTCWNKILRGPEEH
ncbi:interleukin-7 isoform X2 [Saccopteryx leptura]|uniref:interleukin-7 isoform X2 n=1 Tax=Saccopteryx leptura TaxID=249018 RepID=UPI00339BEC06